MLSTKFTLQSYHPYYTTREEKALAKWGGGGGELAGNRRGLRGVLIGENEEASSST